MRIAPAGIWAFAFVLGAFREAPAASARLHDAGIFSDLDGGVRIALPARLAPRDVRMIVDANRRLLLIYDQDFPLKAYPLEGALSVGPIAPVALLAALRAEDAAELRGLVSDRTVVERTTAAKRTGDADGDGIPDPLDVLMGARKLVANHAVYTEGYYKLSYPGGDVPRAVGVCSDTVVRAFRNAGIDLQTRLTEDIRAAPSAYPGISRPDSNIDHRRVKNLLRWFQRHVPEVREGPYRPGDIVFMDTFPGRPGPEHVGIVSDRGGPSGQPLVINNWTVGYSESEMNLLPAVPVTNRFRLK